MNNRKSWAFALDLDAGDIARLRNAIREELHYYNALVNGFSAPIRSMRDTLMSFKDGKEQLFATVAGLRCNVRNLKADSLLDALKPYSGILFKDGRLDLDSKSLLILDIATSVGNVPPLLRMAMATEVLRTARQHAGDIAANKIESTLEVANSYSHTVTLLSPISGNEKRHCQFPRFSVNVSQVASDAAKKGSKGDKEGVEESRDITIRFPYLSKPVTMQEPPFKWSLAIIREDADGKWLLEISAPKTSYIVGKTDFIPRKKGRK